MIYVEGAARDKPVLLFRSIMPDATVTPTTETADGSAQNAVSATTFDFWSPTAVPASLDVDAAADEDCDMLCIAAHNLGTLNGSVELQQETAPDTYVTVAGPVFPEDDTPIMLAFDEVTTDGWRIVVTADSAFAIGVIMLGQSLTIPGGVIPPYVPMNSAMNIASQTNKSLNGHYLGTRITKREITNRVNFASVRSEWAEANLPEFEAHINEGGAFFFAAAPTKLPSDTAYCWRADGGELRPSYTAGAELVNISLDLEAYGG
jgi:hypothetical protein